MQSSSRVVLVATADTWVGLSEDAYYDLRTPDEVEPPRGHESQVVTGRHGEYRGVSVAFVAFDRPEPGVAARIERARLEMYSEQAYGGPLPTAVPLTEVFEVAEAWDESTMNAYTAPRLGFIERFVQPIARSHAVPGEWASWDVTDAVRRSSNADQWHGFWLITGDKQWISSFSSRESGNPPRLVLDLAPVSEDVLYIPAAMGGRHEGEPHPTPMPTPPIAHPPLPPPDAPDMPRLELEVARAALGFGATPVITATWHNASEAVVPVILPVDASSYAWRMPMYVWQVTRADGLTPRSRFAGRCSCFDPLTAEDFVDLQPGSRRAAVGAGKSGALPGPAHHYSFVEPGQYDVRLVYLLDKLGGVPPADVGGMWSRAREMTVVSRQMSLTVEPPIGAYASRLELSRQVKPPMSRSAVESVMGVPDQAIDEAFAPHRTYLIYYLADPRSGDPPQLPSPQTDLGTGDYWRPRFVVTLGGDGVQATQEALLLP